jgi:hypothetical protein
MSQLLRNVKKRQEFGHLVDVEVLQGAVEAGVQVVEEVHHLRSRVH